MQTPETISAKHKNLCWWLAWLGAGLITMGPSRIGFSALAISWMFPLGLLGVFDTPDANLPGPAVLIAGWLIYIALTIFGLKEQNRSRFYLFYAVLITLLVFNATACRMEIKNFRPGC
jgi:hypothetical protein